MSNKHHVEGYGLNIRTVDTTEDVRLKDFKVVNRKERWTCTVWCASHCSDGSGFITARQHSLLC